MQATDKTQVIDAITAMVRKYPNAKWEDGNVSSYLDELDGLPLEAILWAISEAPAESPNFVPPAPMLRVMAVRKSVEIRAQNAQRTFETMAKTTTTVTQDRAQAAQDFFKLCDDAKEKNLGETINDDNRHVLHGILRALGLVYGIKPAIMMGGEKDPGFAKPLVAQWGVNKKSAGTRNDNWSPYKVIDALRQVPSLFLKFPTEGMIRAVVRGEGLNAFPDEWIHESARTKAPEQSQVARQGAAFILEQLTASTAMPPPPKDRNGNPIEPRGPDERGYDA